MGAKDLLRDDEVSRLIRVLESDAANEPVCVDIANVCVDDAEKVSLVLQYWGRYKRSGDKVGPAGYISAAGLIHDEHAGCRHYGFVMDEKDLDLVSAIYFDLQSFDVDSANVLRLHYVEGKNIFNIFKSESISREKANVLLARGLGFMAKGLLGLKKY